MNKTFIIVLSLFIYLIYLPMIHPHKVKDIEYFDVPIKQIKQETTKNWFVFKQKRKRYFHRRYA